MTHAGEKAMALVDGQLAPAEVPGLVDELARNTALVAELQQYLAVSRSRIAGAYAGLGDEPVPARLVEAVTSAAEAAGAMGVPAAVPRRGSRPPVRKRLHAWLRATCRVPAWSLVATPACAALAALAVALPTLPHHSSAPVAIDLDATLERTASGEETALATLRPMLSFASRNAGWCRQFEVRNAGRQVSHGLACRSEGGNWNVVASTRPAPAGYRPAGAGRRKMIDDLATSMMRGQPLSRKDEAATIGGGWRRL